MSIDQIGVPLITDERSVKKQQLRSVFVKELKSSFMYLQIYNHKELYEQVS